MVLFLIQYRKYINFFVEQSLLTGMWGQFQHEVIAISAILIARYEIKSFENNENCLPLKNTYNKLLNTYTDISSVMVKNCIITLYAKVYYGAMFPYETEIGDHFDSS